MKLLSYILFEKYTLIFYHLKWPAQGTGTVPIVSAHFRSLYQKHPLGLLDSSFIARSLKAVASRFT